MGVRVALGRDGITERGDPPCERAIQSHRGVGAAGAGTQRLRRALAVVVAISCVAVAAGCDWGERPYDTPRARVEGDQAVALLRREVERRRLPGSFPRAERVETRTPSGIDAWLVRLVSDADGADLCGYVWRGEEPETGRVEGTVIEIRFDDGCEHWPD